MIHRLIAGSGYIVLIAIISIFAASVALMLYEAVVVASTLAKALVSGSSAPTASKALAASLIEAIDVFLIAIVAYITSIGLYVLFVDGTAPIPKWFSVRNLDDLKGQLVSVIVAVLAVLFLQEAVQRAGEADLIHLALAIALMIGVLTLFLKVTKGNSD
ncbi:YqhA family protein [Roseococcus pinisoli]|uniref:YqhA family protein n=1 Tax=Roseococcus pinisoli TaxID=2835040 RepID=A0ABS5Q7C1_9PROT|nr:YqhA family protein [Roseococcus pinisoli]MBS7809554.1 YqhA family protein [Roseococcus pinisoli]